MKFIITMKDPDGVYDSVQDAAEKAIVGNPINQLIGYEGVRDQALEKILEKVGKWFEYGEYLQVEVDLDEMTCKVLEV